MNSKQLTKNTKQQANEIKLLQQILQSLQKQPSSTKKSKKSKKSKEGKKSKVIVYDNINIDGISYLYNETLDEIYNIDDKFGISIGNYNRGNILWKDGFREIHESLMI